MKNTYKILGICGSLRVGSFNKILLDNALSFCQSHGHSVYQLDLGEQHAMPVFNEDTEYNEGMPETVKEMREMIRTADIVLFATPEYNHSVPGGLKNAIDWASRSENVFDGKVAAIFGASTTGFGTVRAQNHLRQILEFLNVNILPQPDFFLSHAQSAFTEDGQLVDQEKNRELEELVARTIKFYEKIKTG